MSELDEKKKGIVRKIKALQAKTPENGCTEEEVIEASRIIGILLDEYNLTMTDVELGSQRCVERFIMTDSKRNEPPISYCMQGIAHYCDIEIWKILKWVYFPNEKEINKRHQKRLHYDLFGLEKDVEVAEYLYHVINSAIQREYKNFVQTDNYQRITGKGNKKIASNSFQRGLVQRIDTRLYLMKKERNSTIMESTGRDLIPLKNNLVMREKNLLGYNFTEGKTRHFYNDFGSYHQGMKAGDKVSLNKGIGSSKKPQLLA